MKKCRLIVLCLLVCLLLTGMAAGQGKAPYAIRVNRAANTVTIYEPDEAGQYTIPVKAMICSTARPGYTTPLGTYKLAEFRSEWRLMLDGTYGQYATCFKGHYLFHSICYSDDRHDAMEREAYNNLGSPASMGCVRLETIDAKWIFDNCPAGTPVTIYDDAENPGPLGKPERTVDEITEEMHNGWDPTDPAPGNPWKNIKAEKVTVEPARLTLTAGEASALAVEIEPANAALIWKSSDETVAVVDKKGNVTALKEGTVQITAEGTNGVSDSCTLRVKGKLLPYDDLQAGAWYYPELRKALERGMMQGVAERSFAPDGPMTRAMVVQVFYNLQKKHTDAEPIAFEDVVEDAWYYDAVAWAVAEGAVSGVSKTQFAPDRAMTRQELAAVLWRYAGKPDPKGDLSAFSDGKVTADYAKEAMAWIAEKNLMEGLEGKLQPNKTISRVETAVTLQRFAQLK